MRQAVQGSDLRLTARRLTQTEIGTGESSTKRLALSSGWDELREEKDHLSLAWLPSRAVVVVELSYHVLGAKKLRMDKVHILRAKLEAGIEVDGPFQLAVQQLFSSLARCIEFGELLNGMPFGLHDVNRRPEGSSVGKIERFAEPTSGRKPGTDSCS